MGSLGLLSLMRFAPIGTQDITADKRCSKNQVVRVSVDRRYVQIAYSISLAAENSPGHTGYYWPDQSNWLGKCENRPNRIERPLIFGPRECLQVADRLAGEWFGLAHISDLAVLWTNQDFLVESTANCPICTTQILSTAATLFIISNF